MNKYKKVEEFIGYIRDHKIISKRTIEIKEGILRRFLDDVNKEIDEITDKDISEFLKGYKLSTRDLNLIQLREFFRWYYKLDKKDRLPNCIKDFELSSDKTKRKQQKKDRIVTKEEYKKLQDGIKDVQYKAILEILWRTGARIGEITSMNSSDVKDEGNIISVTVKESKTIPRIIPIPVETEEEIPKNILNWFFECQPYKDEKGKPMFIGRKTLKRMNPKNIGEIITKLNKKIIGRNITCHDFRHTAITRDREEGMPDTFIEAKYGLMKGSKMMRIYDKNGEIELRNYYLKKINVTEKRESIDEIKNDRDKVVKNLEKKIEYLEEMLSALQKDFYDDKGYVYKSQKLIKVEE